MASINAFQTGQQFQSLQEQRKQDVQASKENILIRQQQNARADKSFTAQEQQRAIENKRRATADQRLAAADLTAKAERDRVGQLRAVQNTVKFVKAGLASGKPVADILQAASQPLQALGVDPSQFGALAQQIQNDPGVLDQFAAALTKAEGPRRAIGRPTAVRLPDGNTALLQTFSDGSSEVVQGAAPLTEELAAGRLDVARERIAPAPAGELAEAKAEGKAVGKAAGEIAAEDLDKSRRFIAAAKRTLETRQDRGRLLDKSVDEAIKAAGFFTTGFIGQALSGIGGTPARDLSATLDTIRANIGFDELQRMRDNSPTGGALGQVSERENTLLQSVLKSVEQSQSEAQFKRNLSDLKEQFALSQKRLAQAFEDDKRSFEDGAVAAPGPQAATGLSAMSDEELAAAIAAAQGAQ